jgi:hypothetical protein
LIPLERFTFTEESKKQLIQNLAILLEQNLIQIPHDEQLIAELKAMRYEYGQTGNRLKMVSGISDDCVMSLALAVYGLTMKLPSPQAMAWKSRVPKQHSKTNAFF